MIYYTTTNEKVCNSCIIYIVLFVIAFIKIIGISRAYFYFHWYLKKVLLMLIMVLTLKLEQQFDRHINGK